MLPREIQVVLSCQGPAHDPFVARLLRRYQIAQQIRAGAFLPPSFRTGHRIGLGKTCASQKAMSVLLPIATAKATSARGHVCFTPESGYVQCNGPCLLWANRGHRGPYSNMSSARPMRVLGMVKTSAYEVYMLNTILYLV